MKIINIFSVFFLLLLLVGGVNAVTYTINPTYDNRLAFVTTQQPWAYIHDNTSATVNSSTLIPSAYLAYGDTTNNNLVQINRAGFTWDTSFILPNDTINFVMVGLRGLKKSSSGAGNFNNSLVLVSFNPSNKLNFILSDYYTSHWGSTALAPNISTTSYSPNNWNNFTCYNPITCINAGGLTTMGARVSSDVDNTPTQLIPDEINLFQFSGEQNTTQVYRPIMLLDITHYSASGIIPLSITNLQNTTPTTTAVNFSWSNPDPNITYIQIWKNNVYQYNISAPINYDNWTGLSSQTSYTFSARTFNDSIYINTTWVNTTITTIIPTTSPIILNNTDAALYACNVGMNYISWCYAYNTTNLSFVSASLDGIKITDFDINAALFTATKLDANSQHSLTMHYNNLSISNITSTLLTPQSDSDKIIAIIFAYIIFIIAILCILAGTQVPVLAWVGCGFAVIGIGDASQISFWSAFIFMCVFCAGVLVALNHD